MSAFVGRTAELETLAGVAARADDAPTAAVVVGDPGTGKSRLLAEAANSFDRYTELRVVGYEAEQHVPLAAASDLLRALTTVPQLGAQLDALVFAADRTATLEPMRVFEAAHRALGRLEPVLLLVDDLQWTDELSRALCHYLARAAEATGQWLTLFAAARPSAEADAFARSLASVLPGERLVTLELGVLPLGEAIQLVDVLAPGLDVSVARALAEKSGGSPFWLEALVRTKGADVDAGRLVTSRLRGAGTDASALLALLVAAARPLALADIAILEEWAAERAEYAAAELVSRGIAVHTAGGIGLVHDLVRAAVAAEIPGEKRRDVHRRLALWLEQGAGSDLKRLREALDHRHRAAVPSLELALRLALAPQRTLLGDDGLALLVRIADEEDPSDARVVALNAAIAELAAELASHSVALDRLSLVADHTADALQRASALLAASRSAFAMDDERAAHRYLERVRAVGVEDPMLDLEVEIEQAVIGLWSGEERDLNRSSAQDVVTRTRRAIGEAGGVDVVDARVRGAYLRALRVEYDVAFQSDDVETLVANSEERASVARGLDEEAYLAALIDGARALRRDGRLVEAEELLRRARTEAHRRVLPQRTIDAAYWLAVVLEQRGRIFEADEVVGEAMELAGRVGDEARARHRISRLPSKIAFHRGDWRGAIDALAEQCRLSGTHGRIELRQDGALWLSLVGGKELEDEVLSWLADARACAEHTACPRCGTELELAAAEALVRIGRVEDAGRALAAWRARQQRPQPRDEFVRDRIEALLGAQRGDDSAIAGLENALREGERLDLLLDAMWTRIDLGRIVARADRERAVDLLRHAAESAAQLGAATEEHVAEKSLRGLGVRTWKRGRTAESLTEREREIVRLIASGASNPEIARELFLSRKTIERHVSNVLRKVGAKNRAELAARVAELELEGAHR